MIRKAEAEDLNKILDIYEQARHFMAANGNAGQWGTHYPPKSLVKEDIALGQLYVMSEADSIHGVFMFATGEDPTYEKIEEGAWLSDAPYGVIHRVASDGSIPGFLGRAVQFCEEQITHLRIDTHKDNHVMQHVIAKNGFQKCGIIYTDDGSPRIAYEKTSR